MAPLPEIEGVTRAAFKWGPVVAVNVLHFHQDTANPNDLFIKLDAHLDPRMWNCVSTSQRIVELDLTVLDGSTATVSFIPPNTTKWKGSAGGENIPALAAVVKKTTAIRGRTGRGRTYVGPATESENDGGRLLSTTATNLAAGWTAFQSAMIADDIREVVASYKDGTAFTVLNYTVRNAYGTMRMRQSRLAG